MSAVRFSNPWDILNWFHFKTSFAVPNELLCTLCYNILVDARMAPCGCRYCEQCTHSLIETGNKYCCNSKQNCKRTPILSISSFQVDNATNKSILSLIIICPYTPCEFECELKYMEEHMKQCDKNIADNNLQYSGKENDENVENIQSQQNGNQSNFKYVIETMKKEIKSLKELERKNKVDLNVYKHKLKTKDKDIEILQEQIDEQKKLITELHKSVNDLKESNEHIYTLINKHIYTPLTLNPTIKYSKTKPFLWRVKNFSKKQKESNSIGEIFSDPFYSHDKGYKLCLGMNPGGATQYRGKYLFVFFCIMNGPNDQHLNWPMKYELSLSIIDQDTLKDHKTFKFKYETTSEMLQHAFSKPINDKNDGIGDNEFISFKELNSCGNLLKNDIIMIRCFIESFNDV